MSSTPRVFIPIGVDCGAASYLRHTGRRTASFPFDWLVTYRGVATCLQEGFQRFLPVNHDGINAYDMYFMHDYTSRDGAPEPVTDAKFHRRCERVMQLLQSCNQQVIFWRKSHMAHHHVEQQGKYCDSLSGEIENAELLSKWLRSTFPALDYRILLTLNCTRCFPPGRKYHCSDPHVLISTTADQEAWAEAFESLLTKVPTPAGAPR